MALDRFIPLSEAAHRMRMSVKETRALIKSGKIKGGILPDGETVVSEDALPKRKEDLPEYKKYTHLKGAQIWISEAARRYNLRHQTVVKWVKAGHIKKIGKERNRVVINEQDVAYCAEIYHHNSGQGKTLFNADGTPFKPKNGSSSN